MDELSHDDALDAGSIVEQLRSLVAEGRNEYPRTWVPRATYEDLVVDDGREPIHLLESLHYLHHHWDMANSRMCKGIGWGPKAIVQRVLSRIVNGAMSHYYAEEQAFRSNLARAIDAIAYRVDNISYADQRALLGAVRQDLIDLARHLEHRLDAADNHR